ncbi:MAG: DegV family protein [Clostridiales bacterium]|nr:DegV family protein [Clostridiales bacterium]
MPGFKIIADSASDLPEGYAAAHDITVVPYSVTLDGETYYHENVDMTVDEFYARMTETKVFPKTSQLSIADHYDAIKPYAEAGTPVVSVCMTSKFTGSYNSLISALAQLREDYPDAEVYPIDSLNASACESMLIQEIVRMRRDGRTAAEAAEICERLKSESNIFITVDTLEYLQRGGRIGKVSAMAGALLGIKPIIQMSGGELLPYSKIRGRRKAINETIRLTEEFVGGGKSDYLYCVIGSSGSEETGYVADALRTEYGEDFIYSCRLGITITAHIGPTVLGVAALKKYDRI